MKGVTEASLMFRQSSSSNSCKGLTYCKKQDNHLSWTCTVKVSLLLLLGKVKHLDAITPTFQIMTLFKRNSMTWVHVMLPEGILAICPLPLPHDALCMVCHNFPTSLCLCFLLFFQGHHGGDCKSFNSSLSFSSPYIFLYIAWCAGEGKTGIYRLAVRMPPFTCIYPDFHWPKHESKRALKMKMLKGINLLIVFCQA